MKNTRCSKIIGIQFSILSPEEIRKGSVAEITSRETYNNNKPVIGGLFDPRMGVLESGLICPTDGLDYMKTPGYFGHIELARPVYYIQYLSTVLKILKCVCFKCSKLKISKTKYKQALKMLADARWKYVFSIASKIGRCGEDIEDGCGCLQPSKIRKEGLSTVYAEWAKDKPDLEGGVILEGDTGTSTMVIKITPEIVLKILKRISDEDVFFMGFNPLWSRPDWMICQVMAVPPPAVRPSVKHDAQQRSEDDLSHILVNILKTNNTLLEKMKVNAMNEPVSNGASIDDWTMMLQYFVAAQVDNKIPGVPTVAQRSGRPLKTIKDRLNGKGGRMRGNLMAKRVDFSARSVITADPNISIKELGIPMKIAKNITKPDVVNDRNRAFLLKLVRNGDVYPGAKILERKNGVQITLRYMDRESIVLENGDIVHRHMMNGDIVLFNRQPTLHRMSMMAHVARVMKRGDTFRMNVADTKPYNADFDGDEMNLHMPQDVESESELKNLAAVPYQIISPSNNSPIIGIYQDSMLGSYQFTRENITFTRQQAMNLLMMFDKVNAEELNKNSISSFDILTQIMPPLSLRVKNKQFEETEQVQTSNNVVELVNGKYVRGQMDKSTLGSGTKGLIHRTNNDFGSMTASKFIDDLQNVVTEYMKTSGFSVGISDLISTTETTTAISKIILDKKTEIKDIIDQTQIGAFINNSGKTNEEEFETQVNNLLNQASSDAGKAGLKNLGRDNRFVVMVNAGSKGSEINIAQMISCLGQQNVDGRRIPYGFENRTLPHYSKYNDSMEARGFVESSYINGLSPQELFFHAMAGRVGLIDTAVKTSTTGYIQRKLIKGLEDLMVNYDMTIRTNKGKIVQFSYGEDSIDTMKVENQELPIASMTVQDMYNYFNIQEEQLKPKALAAIFTKQAVTQLKKDLVEYRTSVEEYINLMQNNQKPIVQNIFKNKDEKTVRLPVAFQHIIDNVAGQQRINSGSYVDITPLEALKMIKAGFDKLMQIYYAPPTLLFKIMYFYYLSPIKLLCVKRFNRIALSVLIETIQLMYKRAIVTPGEVVGLVAAQSIGETSTQMTLNTFHFAGVSSKSNVTRGVPRIDEILSISSEPKNPSLTVFLKPEDEANKEAAYSIMHRLEHTKLSDVVSTCEIYFDPDVMTTLIEHDTLLMQQFNEFEQLMQDCGDIVETDKEQSKWVIRLGFDAEVLLHKNITMDDINFAINGAYQDEVTCMYSDYNADNLVFRIRMQNVIKNSKGPKKIKVNPLDQQDQIQLLRGFQEKLLDSIVLRGVHKINKVILRKVKDTVVESEGAFKRQDIWVLDTIGTNMMDVIGLDYIDGSKTFSNDINEIYNVLGIEAARQTIYNEIVEVIEFDGVYVNHHHFSLLCDRMTFSYKMISIFRHGINNDNIGPIAKASFEETPEMFMKAAKHGELDNMRGVSANVMCGQEGFYGTSSFQVILDLDEMKLLGDTVIQDELSMENLASELNLHGDDECSRAGIGDATKLYNKTSSKSQLRVDFGNDDDYNPFI
jgi:DNA-directed RNA polymerase II subunit RPB1